jgi:uncharacterized protein (TIGR02145 family)
MKLLFSFFLSILLLQLQAQTHTTILFESDRFTLTADSKEQLINFVKDTRIIASVKIELYGHCDSAGSATHNELLSIRRVESVNEFLLSEGIAEASITIKKGYGESKPLNDNATKEQRSLNRRVELVVTADTKDLVPALAVSPTVAATVAPTIAPTTTVTGVTARTATSGGNITSDGGSAITASGVCWSTSQNPTTADAKTTDAGTAGSYTSRLTGLSGGTIYYVRSYATNVVSTVYGSQVNFTTSANSPSPTFVTIGTQVWTNKNLDITTYRNDDMIPQVTDSTEWASLTTGAWCYYNNDSTTYAKYGKLYNWYAVNDPRGLAPTGWHIPTNGEWSTLTTYLGGDVAGGKMKESGTLNWSRPNKGASNKSRFTALPGGYRNSDGPFYNVGSNGDWWSSSETDTFNGWYNFMDYLNGNVGSYFGTKQNGLSVRCLRD